MGHQILPLAQKDLAERSFDLRTSGLWAQHASTAPLCYLQSATFEYETMSALVGAKSCGEKNFCQKWDSNPRPQKWTAT